ncbi:MAG: hypothetical protein JWL81_1672 [Verrucomicrobiales bacterium]|nr:hypothetical protein [Verrucomicrobiales bacterium]
MESCSSVHIRLKNSFRPNIPMLFPLKFSALLGFGAGLILAGQGHGAPVVSALTPAAGSSLAGLTSISVTFNESVSGVEADDLEIGGAPASGLTGAGAGPYIFTFTEPAAGTVAAGWGPDHGIAGLGTGAFVPVGGWTYLLADTAPPTLGRLRTSVSGQEMPAVFPIPGSTVGGLTQVSVTFSEEVQGVDAGDLLVNGAPCNAVVGSGAGPWLFSMPAPPVGTVNLTWSASPGILDAAGNAFAGTPWTVTRAASAGSVILTEFLALNGGVTTANINGIRDENHDLSGFVELANAGAAPVDLLGWSLTDDASEPRRWVFPSRILAAGARLVVWTSGKDRKPAAADAVKHLHTNFGLNPSGGTLALFPPDAPSGVPASAFNAYPPQRHDFSYGSQAGDNAARYFSPASVTQPAYSLPTSNAPVPSVLPAVPTGTANPASSLTALAAEPEVSVKRGIFSNPFSLVLTSPDPAATIRYTLNGTVPSATSPAYTAPLAITTTTLLRCAAFRTGLVPSSTVTHSYVFPASVFTQASPPYDNPALTTDNTNPPVPLVGDTAFPIHWGTQTGVGFPGQITNLTADQIPADYGVDSKIHADPTRYADNGAVDAVNGKTNAERMLAGLKNLPILSVVLKTDDMFGANGIYPKGTDGTKPDLTKACSMELLLPEGGSGFHVDCGIDLHGNASRSPANSPKHGFTIKFKGRYGAGELQAALFPDSPAREWDKLVLRGDYNSSWIHGDGATQRPKGIRVRDAWAKDTFRDMGRVAGHARFANLFINGIYWGNYELTEDETADFGANYFGGTEAGFDVIDQGVLKSGTWTVYYAMKSLLGWTGATYNTVPAVPGTTFTNAQLEQLKQHLDVPWFIDYMLHHYFTGHEDWGTQADYNKNWYAIRPKNGTFKYLPWDQENLLWSPSVNRVTGALYPPTAIHPRVVGNAEYKLLFADRAHRHMVAPDGALQPAANSARLDRWTSIVNADAMCLESARWGDYRYKVHQRSAGPYTEVYTWNGKWFENNVLRSNTTNSNNWLSEINRLKTAYFPARTATVLAQLRTAGLYPALNAPQFRNADDDSLAGSRTVPAGFRLKMQQPLPLPSGTVNGGTVYYTLDGNDPRVAYTTSGELTPGAAAYSVPIVINGTVTVKARVLNGTAWSAMNEAVLTVAGPVPDVRITEIHYNAKGSLGGSAAEFLEIRNIGSSSVDVGLWSMEGVRFIIPLGTILAPGARLVVASNDNPVIFSSQYPGVSVIGYYKDSLSNGGETVRLLDARGMVVDSVSYRDSGMWPTAADGSGYSLEKIEQSGPSDDPLNWRASVAVKGTPGSANQAAPAARLVISEFLANHGGQGGGLDFIELRNAGSIALDAGGWSVRHEGAGAVLLPAGTVLAPGGHLLLPCTADALPGLRLPAPLGDAGGEIQLVDPVLQLAGRVEYGPQIPGYSFSRSGVDWVLTLPSPGGAAVPAAVAAVSKIRLNEWLADPPAGESDWLELVNTDSALPFSAGSLFVGAAGQAGRVSRPCAIAAGGFLVLPAERGSTSALLPFNLPAEGAVLKLLDLGGMETDTLTYGPQSPEISQGRMPDGSGPVAVLAYPSPGLPNFTSLPPGPRLNEILAINPTGPNTPWATRTGWIEVKNPTASGVDLSGWSLGRGTDRWAFPAGTTLAAGAVLAVWADPMSGRSIAASAHLNCGMDLSSDEARLGVVELADPTGRMVDRVTFGWQIPGVSLIRTGESAWALAQANTRGAANTPVLALTNAAVKINEWLAEPGLLLNADFVELHNPGTAASAIGGIWLTDDPSDAGLRQWRIPANSFIAPGGQVWFRMGSAGDPAVIPFALSGSGDSLRLGAGNSGAVLVDEVGFGNAAAAAAQGRLPDGAAVSASALAPTPGLANRASGGGPVFVIHPQDVALPLGAGLTLKVRATSGTLQWFRDGLAVPGASQEALNLGPLALGSDAVYTCQAKDGAVVAVSLPARVTVLVNYAMWAAAGGAGEAGADDDGDGVLNFMEFLGGTNRAASDVSGWSGGVASTVLPGQPGGRLFMEFPLDPRASFSGLEGQLSGDLEDWRTAPANLEEMIGNMPGGIFRMRWSFDLPEGSTRHFLRLQLRP